MTNTKAASCVFFAEKTIPECITTSSVQKMEDERLHGNTLLEGVCIRLALHPYNHDMTHHEYEGGFMHVYDKPT